MVGFFIGIDDILLSVVNLVFDAGNLDISIERLVFWDGGWRQICWEKDLSLFIQQTKFLKPITG